MTFLIINYSIDINCMYHCFRGDFKEVHEDIHLIAGSHTHCIEEHRVYTIVLYIWQVRWKRLF